MQKIKKILSTEKIDSVLLLYLLVLTQSIFFLKFFAFPLFFIINKKKFIKNNFYGKQFVFYILIILYSTITSLVILFTDFSFKYAIVFIVGLLVWLLCLINVFIINLSVYNISVTKLIATLKFFFIINCAISALQFVFLMIEYRTINPFTSEIGMSAGDSIKGVFANSSVNMIISSFYFILFFTYKNWKYCMLAALIMLLTTYMSGILIFIGIFIPFVFFVSKFSFIKKLASIGIFLFFSLAFYFLSKDNIDYIFTVTNTVLEDVPPRKITSFQQTFNNLGTSSTTFLFGNGMGNFSSRLAFIAGGEYVSWYPSSLVVRNKAFNDNHFQLWNYEVLDVPFSDGTANQPFSVYNQFLGEYGIIGFLILSIFYVAGYFFEKYKNIYSTLLLFMLLAYMLLDYWFEYFSVIIFFELISALWKKENYIAKKNLAFANNKY